jgi:hypothetical protein
MTPQNIKFKVIAINSKGTYSLEKYFLGGDNSLQINDVPTSRIVLSDKNRVLSNIPNGYISPTETFWVAVSASTDSGGTWERTSIGLAENYNITLNPSGERQVELIMYDAPEMRHNYTTPNQICLGDCDIGQLFVGTATASDGTSWSMDSRGNYPNGLLYDTNFSYSSRADFFPDVNDVPMRLGYNNEMKIDTIKNWLSDYGMSFILDCRNGLFYVKQNPYVEKYPFSGIVLQVGDNINKLQKKIDLGGYKDAITVVSTQNGVFDIYGDGSKERLLTDNNLISYKGARVQSKRLFNSTREIPAQFGAVIPPTNQFLIGQSVIIRELDGDEETASVVGMNQKYDGNRWETDLVLDEPSYSVAKSIIDIQDALGKQSSGDLEGQAFIRVSSGASEFAQVNPTVGNICAVGFGLTSDTDSSGSVSTQSGIETPIIIKGLSGYISDSDDDGNIFSAYSQLASDEGNGLIRQIVLLGNTNIPNQELRYLTTSVQWYRPVTEWNAGQTNSTPFILKGTTSNKYLLDLNEIVPISLLGDGYFAYPRSARDLIVRSLNIVPNTYPVCRPVDITATYDGTVGGDAIWEAAGQTPDGTTLENISQDMTILSYTYSVGTFTNITMSTASTQSSGKPINLAFSFDMPVEPRCEAWKYWKRTAYGFDTWASYSHCSGSGWTPVLLFLYNAQGFVADANTYHWTCMGTISNAPFCVMASSSLTASMQITDSYNITPTTVPFDSIDLVSTDSGRLRMCLFVPTLSGYQDATLSLFVQYAGMTTDIKIHSGSGREMESISEQVVIEPVYETKNKPKYGGYFKYHHHFHLMLPTTAKEITGIYASASQTDGGYYIPNDYENLLKEHSIYDPIKKEFTTKGLIFWTTKDPPYEMSPESNANYRIASVKKSEDWHFKAIFEKIKKQKYAFIKFVPEIYDANVEPPPAITLDFVSTSFVSGSRGSSSEIYFNMDYAPPYWCKLALKGIYVGSSTEVCGTVGKVSFCSNTGSSLREGIDKNTLKVFNFQYDYHEDFAQSSGMVRSYDNITEARYKRMAKRAAGFDWEFG